MRPQSAVTLVLILLISLFANANAQEMYQVQAQHAGDVLYSGPDFQLHEQTNYLNDSINLDGSQRYFGQPRCQTEVKYEHTATTSRLVAIVDKGRDFNFSRRWLWDNIREPVLNEVIPEHCPNAHSVVVRVFIEGYDVTISGDVYETASITLPKIQMPKAQRISGAMDLQKVQFNNYLEDFVSDGIVQARFLTKHGANGEPCLEHITDCSFETFTPAYRMAGFANRYKLGWRLEEAEREALRLQIRGWQEHGDQNGNFNFLASKLKSEFRTNARIRREAEERAAALIPYNNLKAEILKQVEERGFLPIFIEEIGRNFGGTRCSSGLEYACVEDVPLIVMIP